MRQTTLHWTLLLFTRVVAQNLTDAQLALVSGRLADGAQKSWELGTRTQTILELNATAFSVFSSNPLPPPQGSSSAFFTNAADALAPFFAIPHTVVANRSTASNGTTGPQPFIPDGSAADPASIGMSVLLANWTGMSESGGNNTGVDYAGAAQDQLDFLLERVPRTEDGAISHRVSEVQLWSDFVYMVPPFLAYYGVVSENRTLLMEAYNQISLYRNYLRDAKAKNKWKHILLGQNGIANDEGYWTTGNGWAAAGILRVLATIRNSQYANTMKNQQKDLGNWVKEIHDGMFGLLDSSVNMWTNYPDVPASNPGNFYDASGSALLASTVFRSAVILNQFTHVPAAERVRQTLFSPGSPPVNSSFASISPSSTATAPISSRSSSPAVPHSANSTSATASHSTNFASTTSTSTSSSPLHSATSSVAEPLENYNHLTPQGWLTPVVNPDSFGREGSQSPEGQAFVLQLHAAWRDWVEDGARGANAACRFKDRIGWWFALGWVVGTVLML